MSSGARIVVDGADAAVRRLPGGPVLAAALRPGFGAGAAPSSGETIGRSSAALSAEGSAGTATGTDASSSGAAPAATAVEDQLTESADLNLYYLQLQERISAESREYSALSNVLKARHDTVKNAIGNIR
jgi:hypothetical protein